MKLTYKESSIRENAPGSSDMSRFQLMEEMQGSPHKVYFLKEDIFDLGRKAWIGVSHPRLYLNLLAGFPRDGHISHR